MVCDLSGADAIYHFTGDYTDSSGNGNNATNNGTSLTTDKNSNPNQAITFVAGESDSVDFGFTETGDFSTSTWFKTSTTGAFQLIIGAENGSTNGWKILLFNTNILTLSVSNSGRSTANIGTASEFIDGAYHHLTVTRTGTTWKVYVDKVLRLNTTLTMATPTNNLGLSNVAGNYYTGDMDEVWVFPRVIDQPTIDALYDGYDAPTCTVAGSKSLSFGGGL